MKYYFMTQSLFITTLLLTVPSLLNASLDLVVDASIGSFRLDDVNLSDSSMIISGHP